MPYNKRNVLTILIRIYVASHSRMNKIIQIFRPHFDFSNRTSTLLD